MIGKGTLYFDSRVDEKEREAFSLQGERESWIRFLLLFAENAEGKRTRMQGRIDEMRVKDTKEGKGDCFSFTRLIFTTVDQVPECLLLSLSNRSEGERGWEICRKTGGREGEDDEITHSNSLAVALFFFNKNEEKTTV